MIDNKKIVGALQSILTDCKGIQKELEKDEPAWKQICDRFDSISDDSIEAMFHISEEIGE